MVNVVVANYKDLVDHNQVTGDERNIDWWRKQGWAKIKSFVDVNSSQSSTTQIKRSKNLGRSITLDEMDKWLIVIPIDKAASCFRGKHTDWCVTKPLDGYFEQYVFIQGKTLIFYLELGTPNKYCTTIDPAGNIEYVTPDNVNIKLEQRVN